MQRWTLAAGQRLRHRRWENDEVVVYNDLSGDTHLLSEAAWALLETLRDHSAGTPPDSAALTARLALEPAEQPGLDQMLASLRQLGLVDASPAVATPH